MSAAAVSSSSRRGSRPDAGIVRCREFVFGHLLAQGHAEADAADAAQEAALRLTIWPGAANWPHGRWLIVLAGQCLSSVQRGRIQTAGMEVQELAAPPPADRDSLQNLWSAIARLPAQQAEVFMRCKALGIPAAVVADELGMSLNRVYLADSRAKRRLRQILEPEMKKAAGFLDRN